MLTSFNHSEKNGERIHTTMMADTTMEKTSIQDPWIVLTQKMKHRPRCDATYGLDGDMERETTLHRHKPSAVTKEHGERIQISTEIGQDATSRVDSGATKPKKWDAAFENAAAEKAAALEVASFTVIIAVIISSIACVLHLYFVTYRAMEQLRCFILFFLLLGNGACLVIMGYTVVTKPTLAPAQDPAFATLYYFYSMIGACGVLFILIALFYHLPVYIWPAMQEYETSIPSSKLLKK